MRAAPLPAAPVLATLLREALPGAVVLDLAAPAWPVLPWWPGARCGLAEAAGLDRSERGLLRRFRQGPRGLPVFGLDAAADAAWLAAEPAGHPGVGGSRLVVLGGPPMPMLSPAPVPPRLTPLLEARTMLLRHGLAEGQPALPGPERGRIMLLGGSTARIEGWDLLMPPAAVAPLFDRLLTAAHGLAAALGGAAAWQVGGRMVLPQLASLGMLATGPGQGAGQGPGRAPPLAWPAPALLHDLDTLAEGDALPLGPARQVRLLLGGLPGGPARLRLRLRGGDPSLAPALFLEGRRLAGGACRMEGETCVVEAPLPPGPGPGPGPVPERPVVAGLALPGPPPPGLALLGLEIAA